MREAPFLLIGEGTSEIQKMIISRGLLREYKILNPLSERTRLTLLRPIPVRGPAAGQGRGSTGPG
jgi:hypothetical protein